MLTNIFKIVLKDENEAGRNTNDFNLSTRLISGKRIIVFIHKATAIQSRKYFSILCFAQQLLSEPEGVLNRYRNNI